MQLNYIKFIFLFLISLPLSAAQENPVSSSSQKRTALMLAIMSNSVPIFLHALENTENLEERDEIGRTALMYVFRKEVNESNKELFAKALIKKGANVNAMNDNGATVLMAAVYSCHFKLVELWLNDGAQINFVIPENLRNGNHTALTYAIAHRSQIKLNPKKYKELYYIIELLIQKGASLKPYKNSNNETFESAFIFAIELGDFEVVRLMVLKGADLNEKCNNKTASQFAQEKYEAIEDEEKKENYRKIIELLKNPYPYLNDMYDEMRDIAVGATANLILVTKHNFPEDVAEIVSSYIKGASRESEMQDFKE